jgi:hypothetical protein
MSRVAAAAAMTAVLLGVTAEVRAAPATSARAKAALFGDPTFVPTREGERARRELALAGSLQEHLAADPRITDVVVDVALPGPESPPGSRPRALVSLRGPADAEAALSAAVETAARVVLGDPRAEIAILRRDPEPAAPAPAGHLRSLLALALLGLGASVGVAIDRRRVPRRSRG